MIDNTQKATPVPLADTVTLHMTLPQAKLLKCIIDQAYDNTPITEEKDLLFPLAQALYAQGAL